MLPPVINCICESSYDATSEYGVVVPIHAVTPPPTTAQAVEALGQSAIIALMRVYTDQTFSVPIEPGSPVPHSVLRYYIEVSTQFLGNTIDVVQCEAARTPADFTNPSFLLPIYYEDFCPRAIFGLAEHVRPAGANHLARISIKKFFFTASNTVYVRCRVRACKERPCGLCTTPAPLERRRTMMERVFGKSRNLQSQNGFFNDPQEGETFTNMVKITVDAVDPSGLAWGDEWKSAKEPWLKGSKVVNGTATSPFDALRATGGNPDILKVIWSAKPTPVTDETQGVLSTRLVLTGLDADWGTKNLRPVADALKRTLELNPNDKVLVLGVSKLTSAARIGVSKMSDRRRVLERGEEEHHVEATEKRQLQAPEWVESRRVARRSLMRTFFDKKETWRKRSLTERMQAKRDNKPWRYGKFCFEEPVQQKFEERQLFSLQKESETGKWHRDELETRKAWTEKKSRISTRGSMPKDIIAEGTHLAIAEQSEGTSTLLRELQTSPSDSDNSALKRTQFNVELRLGDGSKVALMQGKISMLALGSPKLTKSFVDKLDEELEASGEQTINLDPDRIGFSEPVVVLSPNAAFVGTVAPQNFAPGTAIYDGELPPGAYVAPIGTPIIVKNSTLEREIIYRGSGVQAGNLFSTPVLIGGGTILGLMFVTVMATFFLHLKRARSPVEPEKVGGAIIGPFFGHGIVVLVLVQIVTTWGLSERGPQRQLREEEDKNRWIKTHNR